MRSKPLVDNFNKSIPLIDELLQFVGDKKELKIADLGSGPVSSIGSYLPGVKVVVYPSDIQDWAQWWEKRRQWWKDDDLKPFIPVDRQDMEKLTYPDEFFDIVWCHNAVDHTRNAKEAVKEMIRVCKTGGWIVIICSPNQLDTGYLHYWNAKEDGTFTNNKETFDLKEFGFKIKFENDFITATLKK